ncbi:MULTISPECIES: nitrilase-related carbon-nitrogen hydrolase [unclassified Streptomyces]|uniref:nitrilase-related carbon-nitrogen hydrolase n=1 Tax=unclassified Streptomyces TaxID=2593676 RepID=UPI002E7FC840|nr:nitrilase-related carbon-nitrogen hydrolase [Streptomyces sp. NBC_00562]WTC83461.1 carbon-nitrogen family hydrolase [Streptomyces sp. NBC_01653]WTD31886.1 carbon-nitrogen family hydrolase [Streptomyces sp. NBC_01643]WTD87403.1 carbon-nitrogen family hydrolase [Streptomyces sp. NBC_01637]WUC18492.1 carbon-nitrogen family hydrolase [Streptomyces sp. NBC_00562]
MADRTLRVGLTQWHATRDPAANTATAVRMVHECAAAGAELVLLPENGLMLGTNTEMRDAALSVDSPEIAALRQAAEEAGTVVVLGGFKRRGADGIRNTALVISASGGIVGGYDKIHLFDARVDGHSFEASGVETAGDRPVLLRVAGTTVGLTICYDVRFPELYRALALSGAEVLLVPAAFTQRTGEAHWEVLLRARAIENAAYVVASATVQAQGSDADDAFPTYGHALAVGPWGDVLADLGEKETAWQVVDLDLSQVASSRQILPVLRGVKYGVYGLSPEIMTADTEEGT